VLTTELLVVDYWVTCCWLLSYLLLTRCCIFQWEQYVCNREEVHTEDLWNHYPVVCHRTTVETCQGEMWIW